MITLKRTVNLNRAKVGRPRREMDESPVPSSPVPRIPRIARLMALAIRFDGLLRTGEVADLATLARLSHVTQPRMTQIQSLTLLAPDIQEELLHLPAAASGKERIHEKALRPIVAEFDWRRQRQLWSDLKSR